MDKNNPHNKDEIKNINTNQEEQKSTKNKSDINIIKMNNINDKFNYLNNTKDNYDKLFIHEYIENIQLIENNQEIIDKKLNYLKVNKDYYNIKRPENDIKLKFKKQLKNLFFEELANNGKKDENNGSYFNINPDAFNCNNNKNNLYKSDGLYDIFKGID